MKAEAVWILLGSRWCSPNLRFDPWVSPHVRCTKFPPLPWFIVANVGLRGTEHWTGMWLDFNTDPCPLKSHRSEGTRILKLQRIQVSRSQTLLREGFQELSGRAAQSILLMGNNSEEIFDNSQLWKKKINGESLSLLLHNKTNNP